MESTTNPKKGGMIMALKGPNLFTTRCARDTEDAEKSELAADTRRRPQTYFSEGLIKEKKLKSYDPTVKYKPVNISKRLISFEK
jgi:hypothetical protein